MKRIAIVTSGGDAPGMNAAVRALTLSAQYTGYQCLGVIGGYNGLIHNDIMHLRGADVNTIIRKGGTVLKSGRCPEFAEDNSAMMAAETLSKHNVDCLIVIGGDGSLRGMLHLQNFWSGQMIALPGTIDNDLAGTDVTIGFHTATQTAVEAIDKIRDTADAFDRIFLVEVMGRESGYLAMSAGISCAAEQILVPEYRPDHDEIVPRIAGDINKALKHSQSGSYLITVAENYWPKGSLDLGEQIKHKTGLDCRVCTLGHIQRGGRPCWQDRLLATRLGIGAIEAVKAEQHMIMVGEVKGQLQHYPILAATTDKKPLNDSLIHIQQDIFDRMFQPH